MEPSVSEIAEKFNALDLALCRATLYSALALGFRPPTEAAIARLVQPENAAALADAAAILETHPHPYERARESTLASEERTRMRRDLGLVATVKILSRAGQIGVAALASSYRALFGHTARGPIPPYETEYGNEALFQQPQELGDLMGFYRAFGLTVRITEHERPDHVSYQCEFLSFLALKEAYALEHQETAMLEETRKATRLFLRDHLGRFLPAFVRKLRTADPGGFYGTLGDFCLKFVTHECDRLAVPIGLEGVGLRPAADDHVPMACGSGSECVTMAGAFNPEQE